MKNTYLLQTKTKIKRLTGKIVYIFTIIKSHLSTNLIKTKKNIQTFHKNHKLTKKTIKNWKFISLIVVFILTFYYGIGALISSSINKNLESPQKEVSKGHHIIFALQNVIKSQVDTVAWTPALPIFFPASTLDNLPNFQLGTKESALFYIKKISKNHTNEDLKKVAELLNYPANIWLFSKTKDDKIAPGSAKQYRKAITHLKQAIKSDLRLSEVDDFFLILEATNSLISKEINTINSHTREHSAELLDFSADNIFYRTQGTIYTIHHIISASIKDFQEIILSSEQYENITSALNYMEKAINLNPVIIKNAAPNDVFEANHLIYLTSYLAQAQNKIQEVYYQTKISNMVENNAN